MGAAVAHGARVDAAARKVVLGRQAQRERELRRSPRADAAPQQARDHVGRRAWRPSHADVLGPAIARSVSSRTSSSHLASQSGDRVAIYLPLIPELAIAMLACARIGAVHTVVFGGFSAESLRDRINDAQAQGARSRPTADSGAVRSCR